MKIRRPDDSSNAMRRRPVAYDRAKEAMIEKRLSRYIHLTCDHITTWELDELYSAWRPQKNKFFCEKCGKWRARKLLKKRKRVPDEPMF